MALRISLLYWFMGAVTAIMLFVSVLLHEKEQLGGAGGSLTSKPTWANASGSSPTSVFLFLAAVPILSQDPFLDLGHARHRGRRVLLGR